MGQAVKGKAASFQQDSVPEVPSIHDMSLKDSSPNKRFTIDTTKLTIHGPIKTVYLCASQIDRPTVDGRPQTMDTLIDQELVSQDAERLKVASPEDPEKHLQTIKREHGLSDRDIDALFHQSGRTRSEGAAELAQLYRYNGMIDLKIGSRIFISQQEVETYFNENPLYSEGEYELQIAIVASGGHPEQQAAILTDQIQKNELSSLPWREPFWIKENELADERQALIMAMKVGDLQGPLSIPGGFEIIRLLQKKEKTLIPLEKRFKTIVNILRQPRFEKFLEEYHSILRNEASIIIHS